MKRRRQQRAEPVLTSIYAILAGVVLFSTFVNLLALTVPLYMMQAFDRVLNSGSVETLAMLTLVAIGCLIVMTGFDIVRSRLLARASARLEYELGPRVLESALLAASRRGAAKSSQPMRDLQEVRAFIVSPGFVAFMDAPWVPLYLLVLCMMHPLLGAVAILGAIALAFIGALGEWLGRAPLREARETGVAAGRKAQAYMSHADVVRAMAITPALKERWLADVDAAFAPMASAADRAGVVTAFARTMRQLLQVATIGVGVLLVLANQMTAGVLSAALLLIARGLAPLEQSIAAWRSLVSAREALERVRESLALLPDDRTWLPEPQGHVQLESVVVLAPDATRPLLGGITLKVAPGEVLAITGPSGAGKSTLARVIAGIDPPARGRVRLDGADLSAWPPEQLGLHVGYLPQSVGLFDGTVAENIAGMEPDSDPYEVMQAAVAAGAHDMILDLPGGYSAEVGHDGELLSAGQRQRIGLARVFFGPRKVLVLDEPNSNLDASGDAALLAAIKAARERMCATVIVTHRREILAAVDRIISLRSGVIEGHAKPVQAVKPAPPATITKLEPRPIEPPKAAAAPPLSPPAPPPSAAPVPRPAARNDNVVSPPAAPPIKPAAPAPLAAITAPAASPDHTPPPSLYISASAQDTAAAQAVARVLHGAGHRVASELPGLDDPAARRALDAALRAGTRVVALVTPRYLQDPRCAEERMHILARDPLDAKGRLIVLRAGVPENLPGVPGSLPAWSLADTRGQPDLQTRIIRAAAAQKPGPLSTDVLAHRRAARPLLHPKIRPDPAFSGHDSALMAIDGALWSGPDAGVLVVGQPEEAAALAREYAWQAHDGFAGIWWVDARDIGTAQKSLAELGAQFIPGLATADDARTGAANMLALLASPDAFIKPWLVVFEDVHDHRVVAALRPRGNTRIVVTSRQPLPDLALPIVTARTRAASGADS